MPPVFANNLWRYTNSCHEPNFVMLLAFALFPWRWTRVWESESLSVGGLIWSGYVLGDAEASSDGTQAPPRPAHRPGPPEMALRGGGHCGVGGVLWWVGDTAGGGVL